MPSSVSAGSIEGNHVGASSLLRLEDILTVIQGTRACYYELEGCCLGQRSRARPCRIWITEDFMELRSSPPWTSLFSLLDLIEVRATDRKLELDFRTPRLRRDRTGSGSVGSFAAVTQPIDDTETKGLPQDTQHLVLGFEYDYLVQQWLHALTACAPSTCQFTQYRSSSSGSRRSAFTRNWTGAHILGLHDELGSIEQLHWQGQSLASYPSRGADGRYVFLSVLGRGSMGEVHLAIDMYFRRFYAIKQAILHRKFDERTGSLRRQGSLLDDTSERVMHEIELMRGLCHPNLVELVDILDCECHLTVPNGERASPHEATTAHESHGGGDDSSTTPMQADPHKHFMCALEIPQNVATRAERDSPAINEQDIPISSPDLVTASDSLLLARERERLRWVRESGLAPLKNAVASNEPVIQLQLVVEFVPGVPIMPSDRLVSRLRLPEELALCTLWQVANGLAFLHARNIVHRDIKPDNLLLHVDGTVKLNDFGTACLADAPDAQCLVGAPAFVAPEIVSKVCQTCDDDDDNDSHDRRLWSNDDPDAASMDRRPSPSVASLPFDLEICKKSDIWSLGATLYYLLFGRPPFLGDTIFELCEKILYEPLTFDMVSSRTSDSSSSQRASAGRSSRLTQRRKSTSETHSLSVPCMALLRGMLDKNPHQRFDIAAVLGHAALRRYERMSAAELMQLMDRARALVHGPSHH